MALLTDFDMHLLAEGTHTRAYEKLGAHITTEEGAGGTSFAVWAPHARSVSVIGDFNGWDPRANPLHERGIRSGFWERDIPGVTQGTRYKFSIIGRNDTARFDKADPYGFAAEVRPRNASIVWDLDAYTWNDQDWMKSRAAVDWQARPISIYEVHLGSWMRIPEKGNRWLTYGEVAAKLADHALDMGYTHVELLPVAEHPLDSSWGYQTVGYYAPTSRFGSPDDFKALIDTLHQRGLGVILDWVPAHFPRDAHGLAWFDGAPLYEYGESRHGGRTRWDTSIFNFGEPGVVNFLVGNALFWLDKYHIDGLRVDAVAAMLGIDDPFPSITGEPAPAGHAGRENHEAIALLRRVNDRVHAEYPGTLTFAEESHAWPNLTRPISVGGLGFDFKWDMGWAHDTLAYLAHNPEERRNHHNQLTFRMLYAFTENFVLPLSHDEVAPGKTSLIARMPGDDWRKYANLRLLYGYMFAQPGKKLMFMGDEFGQWSEWDHNVSIDWHLLKEPMPQGVKRWVQDLNRVYREVPALHQHDCQAEGFAWIDCNDVAQSVLAFLRKGDHPGDTVLVVCNFTPTPRANYRLGVPHRGHWEEILNSDATLYGGSGQGNIGGVKTTPLSSHGHSQSVNLVLPPLAMIAFRHRS